MSTPSLVVTVVMGWFHVGERTTGRLLALRAQATGAQSCLDPSHPSMEALTLRSGPRTSMEAAAVAIRSSSLGLRNHSVQERRRQSCRSKAARREPKSNAGTLIEGGGYA